MARATSEERPSFYDVGGGGGGAQTASSSKPKRSRSACQTPLRTPLRGGGGGARSSAAYNAAAGGNTAVISGSTMKTVDRDRRQNNELSIQIVDKLRSLKYFGADFLQPIGLKSMSTKQFVHIVGYFMQFVVGNARGARIPAEKLTIEHIQTFLTEIGYPYQVKSWLKTPNAPHAFVHVLELLQWLCMFLPDDDDEEQQHRFDAAENLIDTKECCQLCPAEYIAESKQIVQNSFDLWNNERFDECDASKMQLIDRFIAIQMMGQFTTQRQANEAIAATMSETNELLKNRVVCEDDGKLNEHFHRLETLTAECDRLTNESAKRRAERAAVHIELNEQEQLHSSLGSTMRHLRRQISQQSVSREQFERNFAELNQLERLLAVRKNSAHNLQDVCLNYEIQLSRNERNRMKLTTQWNTFVCKLWQDVLPASEIYGFKVHELTIDMVASDFVGHLDNIRQRVRQIQELNQREHEATVEKCIQTEEKLLKLMAEFDEKEHALSNVLEECRDVDQRLLEANVNNAMVAKRRQIKVDEWQRNERDLRADTCEKRAEAAVVTKQIDELRKSNELMLQEFEDQADEIYNRKSEDLEKYKEFLVKFEEKMIELRALMQNQDA